MLLRQPGVGGGDAVSVEQLYERKIKRGIRRRYSKLYERLTRARCDARPAQQHLMIRRSQGPATVLHARQLSDGQSYLRPTFDFFREQLTSLVEIVTGVKRTRLSS